MNGSLFEGSELLSLFSGRLLVFPAWLQHSVSASAAECERVSVSFNVMFTDYTRAMIHALGLINACAARVNRDVGILPADLSEAIEAAAMAVAEGRYDDQFPVDVFQSGSGISTNMNASRIARTALEQGRAVIDVAREQSGLTEAGFVELLDPEQMARPHDHPRAPTHKGGGRGT